MLSLLDESLTNTQIAERLGISENTAKYHVAEILSKLEVGDRNDAARFYRLSKPRPQRGFLELLTGAIHRQSWTLKVAAGALGGVVILAVLGAAVALLLMSSREQPPVPEDGTGDEVLDGIVDGLLNSDSSQMIARFGGVMAREGGVIGGPVGIFGVRQVPDGEWTKRLATSQRSLHAIVRDPEEPFDWWDQSPSPQARAAILAAPRDFDIVLIVEAASVEDAWRFSILDGQIIDVVIDNGLQSPAGNPSQVPLARRLGYLTPSPDDDPGSFLVLPSEVNLPPPVRPQPASGGAPNPPPAPVAAPSVAPAGRTGDPSIDAIIESLLRDDGNTLLARYGRLPGRDEQEGVRVPAADWTARLADSQRSLYAVFTGDPLDAAIVLSIAIAGGASENWQFGVQNGQLVDVAIRSRSMPSLSREYALFYVLPPQQAGPMAPSNHPLSVRTGNAGVDGLIAILEAKDSAGLLASLPTDEISVRDGQDCRGAETLKDAAFAVEWAAQTSAQAIGIHAVMPVPQGYQPAADHMIITITQQNPLTWKAVGLLEREGRIVSVITGGCGAERLYPPTGYVVPPPAGGVSAVSPSRRTGIAQIDAILNAAEAGDEEAMANLIQYKPVPCSMPGDVGGLPCPAGSTPGTLIDALSISVCHGGYFLRADAPGAVIEIARAGLYAVIEQQPSAPLGTPSAPPEPGLRIVLLSSAEQGAVALTLGAQGITGVKRGCFVAHPEWHVGNTQPTFLLPPP